MKRPPLFDPEREVGEVAPEDAIWIVHQFLVNCRRWARHEEIPKRIRRVENLLDPEDAASLHAWLAYLQFTEHALRELEDGTLDHWFRSE